VAGVEEVSDRYEAAVAERERMKEHIVVLEAKLLAAKEEMEAAVAAAREESRAELAEAKAEAAAAQEESAAAKRAVEVSEAAAEEAAAQAAAAQAAAQEQVSGLQEQVATLEALLQTAREELSFAGSGGDVNARGREEAVAEAAKLRASMHVMQHSVAASLSQMEEQMQRGAAAAREQRSSIVSCALSSLHHLSQHLTQALTSGVDLPLMVKPAVSYKPTHRDEDGLRSAPAMRRPYTSLTPTRPPTPSNEGRSSSVPFARARWLDAERTHAKACVRLGTPFAGVALCDEPSDTHATQVKQFFKQQIGSAFPLENPLMPQSPSRQSQLLPLEQPLPKRERSTESAPASTAESPRPYLELHGIQHEALRAARLISQAHDQFQKWGGGPNSGVGMGFHRPQRHFRANGLARGDGGNA
jgi:hypothetical protein